MPRKFIEMRFFGTYYFMNILHDVGRDPFPYIRNLEGFWSDERRENFVAPFPKFSRLHSFIGYIIEGVLHEQLDSDFEKNQDVRKLWVEEAMDRYQLSYEPFHTWRNRTASDPLTADDAYDYLSELMWGEEYEQLMDRLVGEVFFHLFLNRQFLSAFNQNIARIVVSDLSREELPPDLAKYLTRDGVLRRARIPAWVRRAVYYRDRGLCVFCHRDLTGTINLQTEENFDHIVPLAASGMNDVSNIQLLCGPCNRRKRDGRAATSAAYEAWY